MLSFAMDCFLAGLAICLFTIAFREIWRLDKAITLNEIGLMSAAFGGAIFLTARFLMNFVIMWSMWE